MCDLFTRNTVTDRNVQAIFMNPKNIFYRIEQLQLVTMLVLFLSLGKNSLCYCLSQNQTFQHWNQEDDKQEKD